MGDSRIGLIQDQDQAFPLHQDQDQYQDLAHGYLLNVFIDYFEIATERSQHLHDQNIFPFCYKCEFTDCSMFSIFEAMVSLPATAFT